jgi:hypothetical protein
MKRWQSQRQKSTHPQVRPAAGLAAVRLVGLLRRMPVRVRIVTVFKVLWQQCAVW